MSLVNISSKSKLFQITPVSYTHLDVYKRQEIFKLNRGYKGLDEKLGPIRNKKVSSSDNMTKNKDERINNKVSNNDDLNNEFTGNNNDIIKNMALENNCVDIDLSLIHIQMCIRDRWC